MKNIIYKLIPIFILLFSATSCLKAGLDELPLSSEKEITDFDLEYRFVTQNANGYDVLNNVSLTSGVNPVIDAENGTITITPTIPAPTTTFTSEERRKVKLDNIVGFVTVSPAARITPVGNAPKFGVVGNYSQANQYNVTAANGDVKVWTITVNALPEINAYEGFYKSTGDVQHPAPSTWNWTNLEKYYTTINANTIQGSLADNWPGGGTWKINITVNADNTLTLAPAGDSDPSLEKVPGEENSYNPATKTFVLNYRYNGSGGYRIIHETLVAK